MENNDKTVKRGRPYNIHTYRDKEEAERVTKRLKNIYVLNTQWFVIDVSVHISMLVKDHTSILKKHKKC